MSMVIRGFCTGLMAKSLNEFEQERVNPPPSLIGEVETTQAFVSL